jgi:hypothetical protein
MNIPKDEIVKLIESKQGKALADKARQELPGLVDHLEHAPLLAKFGIDPQELLSKVGGAAGIEKAVSGFLGGDQAAKPETTPKPPTSA